MAGPYSPKPQLSVQLRNFVAQRDAPVTAPRNPLAKGALDQVLGTEGGQRLTDLVYQKLASNKDDHDLNALSNEINSKLKNAGGVLLVRYTIRLPNGANQTIPQYAGLRVAGVGDFEAEAIIAYKRAKTSEPPPNNPVCTPLNPTGERQREQATLTSAPEGFNLPYAASVADRIRKTLEKNPRNVTDQGVISQAFVDEEFIFISKPAWEKRADTRR